MKDQIKFAAKAVDKKTGLMKLENNAITSTNGRITIHIECETGIDAVIKADNAIGAANAIKGEMKAKKTGASVMFLGGGAKVRAPIVEDSAFPNVDPGSDSKKIEGDFLGAMKTASLFAADGDVRKFLNGVSLSNGKVQASNGHVGVILDGIDGLDVIIPKETVAILCDVGDAPESASSNAASITFFYPWGWIKSVVIDSRFPEMEKLFRGADDYFKGDILADAVSTIRKIKGSGAKVIIDGAKVQSDDGEVVIESDGDFNRCSFSADLLDKVLSVATEISLPDATKNDNAPGMFKGVNGLIGAIMPMRI